MTEPLHNVQFLDDAIKDLQTLDHLVRTEVLTRLALLDKGKSTPVPLHDFGKTGDLTDCGKIVVVVEGQPEHRIVVRNVRGHFQVIEVVSIADRTQDLPYLLAGLRLERIGDPVRKSDAERRVHRIRRSLDDAVD